MTDDDSSQSRPGLFERIGKALFGGRPDRGELLERFREARDQDVVDGETLEMVEGVFRILDTTAREVMVPRSKMVVLHRDDTVQIMLDKVIESAHSRFPVIGDDRDEVIGILLAKDLLPYLREQAEIFSLRDVLREVTFVPESKRLNAMLQDFQRNRNHMAIVVDEYSGVAGLVTIEDVIEEIVGEIEDEHDANEDALIEPLQEGRHQVDAFTTIDEFNEFFETTLENSEFETIGGMVAQAFGRVPTVGEELILHGFEFRVIEADKRRIGTLAVAAIGA